MSEGTAEPDSKGDSASGQQFGTVAQKAAQAGTPLTAPAIGAHLDQASSTPGAQPPVETDTAEIKDLPNVAAGLPAMYQATRFAEPRPTAT